MDIQPILNEVKDVRSDLARLKGRVGSIDSLLLGLGIVILVNFIIGLVTMGMIWSILDG